MPFFRAEVLIVRAAFVAGCLTVLFPSWAAAQDRAEKPHGKRTALVIGNAKYEATFGKLQNAGNDAEEIARTLKTLGFQVIERQDVSREQLTEAIDRFRVTLPDSEIAVMYYAGHGLSLVGSNYLVPIRSGFEPKNLDPTALRLLAETRLFNAQQAVADMANGGAACNIIILDACRTPAGGEWQTTRSIAKPRGLSEMTPPSGSLIAFAADDGQVAFDGDGKNGLFTEELLKHMTEPGITIEQVFKRTRSGVIRRSGGAQVPAEYSRLVGDDVFLAGASVAPTPAAIPVTKAEAARPEVVASLSEILALVGKKPADEILGFTRSLPSEDERVSVIEALLDGVKRDLEDADTPSPRVVVSEETCRLVQSALPEMASDTHARFRFLSAKALSRRGDALVILGRAEEALPLFDAAASVDRQDAYIIYNRGLANLALGKIEDARADFNAAAGPRYDQPNARRLAMEALSRLKE